MQTTEKEIPLGPLSFHVEITGQGEPLVLIMGLGAPGDKWRPNVAAYQEHFQCITIDNQAVPPSRRRSPTLPPGWQKM
mgnify:CR=1 FL=1